MAHGRQQPLQPQPRPQQEQEEAEPEDVMGFLKKMRAEQQRDSTRFAKQLSAVQTSNTALGQNYGGLTEDACRVKLVPKVGITAVERRELQTMHDWVERLGAALKAASITVAAAQVNIVNNLIMDEDLVRTAAAVVVERLHNVVEGLTLGPDSSVMAAAVLEATKQLLDSASTASIQDLHKALTAIGEDAEKTIRRSAQEQRQLQRQQAATGTPMEEGSTDDQIDEDDEGSSDEDDADKRDPLIAVADCAAMAAYFGQAAKVEELGLLPLIDLLNTGSESFSCPMTLILTGGKVSRLEYDGSGVSLYAAGNLMHTLYEFKGNLSTGYKKGVRQLRRGSDSLMRFWDLASCTGSTAKQPTQQAAAAFLVGRTGRKAVPPPAVYGHTQISVMIV